MATEIAYAKEKFDAIQRLHENAKARGMSDAAMAKLPALPTYVKPIVLAPVVLATEKNGFHPEISERCRKARRTTPERRAFLAERMRELWKDPEFKARVAAKIAAKARARWQDPEYKAAMLPVFIAAKNHPDAKKAHRKNRSRDMRKRWKENREKMLAQCRLTQPLASAASLACRKTVLPPHKTPERKLYAKILRALGPKAAREAMGIAP